jgi:hypothetical protein
MAATDPHTTDHESPAAPLAASANILFSPTGFGSGGGGAVPPLPANQDSCVLTPNSGKEFLSHVLWHFLLNQPPINGVTFDSPDSLGNVSQQIFEESFLFRYIDTLRVGNAFCQVKHPLAGAYSHCDIVLQSVNSISPEFT